MDTTLPVTLPIERPLPRTQQRDNKEFLARHTISEDRTKDSPHEQAQLLALRERTKPNQRPPADYVQEIQPRLFPHDDDHNQSPIEEINDDHPGDGVVGLDQLLKGSNSSDVRHANQNFEPPPAIYEKSRPQPRPLSRQSRDDKYLEIIRRQRQREYRDRTYYPEAEIGYRYPDRRRSRGKREAEEIEVGSGFNSEEEWITRRERSTRATSRKVRDLERFDLSRYDDRIDPRGTRRNSRWPRLSDSERRDDRYLRHLEPRAPPHGWESQMSETSDDVVEDNGIYSHDHLDQPAHPELLAEVQKALSGSPRSEDGAPSGSEQTDGHQQDGSSVPSAEGPFEEYPNSCQKEMQMAPVPSSCDDELSHTDQPQFAPIWFQKSQNIQSTLESGSFEHAAPCTRRSLILEDDVHNTSKLQRKLPDQDNDLNRRNPGLAQGKSKEYNITSGTTIPISEETQGTKPSAANGATTASGKTKLGLPKGKRGFLTSRRRVEASARIDSGSERPLVPNSGTVEDGGQTHEKTSMGIANPSPDSTSSCNNLDKAPRLRSRQFVTNCAEDGGNQQVNVSHKKGHSRQTQYAYRNPASVDKLYQEIEHYRREISRLRDFQPPRPRPRWQVIHRVRRLQAWDHWLDPPRWLIGDRGQKSMQGSLPLSDVENYMDRHPEFAFLVYREYGQEDEQDTFESSSRNNEPQTSERAPVPSGESITINSKDLYEACDNVFNRLPYKPDGFKEKGNYTLHAPYLFIYHSREVLDDCASRLKGQQSTCWKLLIRYIFDEFSEEYRHADALISNGNISNKFMKYLFRPKDVLIRRENEQHLGFVATSWIKAEVTMGKPLKMRGDRLEHGHTGPPDPRDGEEPRVPNALNAVWTIRTYCWRYNGSFCKVFETIKLDESLRPHEETPIRDLNVYPFDYADQKICSLLRARGQTFWKCRRQRYVAYNSPGEQDGARNMDARYMIDTNTYKMLHPGASQKNQPLGAELDLASMALDEPPQEPFVFLLPTEIKGYNLRTKKWVDLEVDRVVDISWNITAFESLVTDSRTKELIHALVTNQLAAEKATDLIAGKGNGLIMLLHGGPGTGKTFTAESVAEIAEKPLYRVTCGDIGTKPEEVEKYLESVLHLGKIWNCVVLLDEADIFLEERTLADLQRNALVSTFLRALEYYSGILILTSNRVGHFDEAFKSRIQLALHYQNLDQRQRRQIWRNFLQRLKDLQEKDIDFADLDKHIDDLAENQMNGRQIRNAITTARQLAIYRKRDLDYQSLQDVIETSSMFDKYLLELNEGNSDDVIARGMGNRL